MDLAGENNMDRRDFSNTNRDGSGRPYNDLKSDTRNQGAAEKAIPALDERAR